MRAKLIGLASVLLLFTGANAADDNCSKAHPVCVECHGQLRDGVVAKGGETTGTTIRFGETTWDLEFKNEAGKTFAKAQHKQPVSVTGSLRRVTGTEVPVRWIVEVERFAARDEAKRKPGANVTVRGTLKRSSNTTGLLIEADDISWPVVPADAALANKAIANINKPVIIQGPLEPATPAPVGQPLVVRAHKLDAAN